MFKFKDKDKDKYKYTTKDVIDNEEKITFTWKDIVALIIAQFEIIMPIALISVGVMSLLVFLLLKFFH